MIEVSLSQLFAFSVPALPPHPHSQRCSPQEGSSRLTPLQIQSNRGDSLSPELKERPRIKPHWRRDIICTTLRSGLQQIFTPKTRTDNEEGVTIQGKCGLDSQEKERMMGRKQNKYKSSMSIQFQTDPRMPFSKVKNQYKKGWFKE